MNSTNTSNIIKIQHNNEIRKFRVENNSFANFVTIVKSIFNLNNKEEELEFYYLDNGEKINFGSDIEFSAVLSTSSPARLFVDLKSTNEIISSEDKKPICEIGKLSDEDVKTILQLKQQMKEINEKILNKKKEFRAIKKQSKEKIISENFNYNEEEVKEERMKLFQLSLEIYELKLVKRNICFKIRSVFKHSKLNDQSEKITDQNCDEKNDNFKRIIEIKEKCKGLKVQIRAQKLLLNNFISLNQKNEIEQQIRDLKLQISQLKEERKNIRSHFNQEHKFNRRIYHRGFHDGFHGGFNNFPFINTNLNLNLNSNEDNNNNNDKEVSAVPVTNINSVKGYQKKGNFRGIPENIDMLRNTRMNNRCKRVNVHSNGPQCGRLFRENTC